MLCYWLRLEIMVALQATILMFLAFVYETDFLFQFNVWSYNFLRKFAIRNEALLFCYVRFKIRQSFFDIKGFLKNLLHIMDLSFQVVRKEVLLSI